jgi:hypothetical protein
MNMKCLCISKKYEKEKMEYLKKKEKKVKKI